ncbi:NAD-dependent epimerase/dehydratase family protein [Streptomyces sp. P38-E01]|uniref:NAD-dependent epimerase/dehydratase family protein n=1 Tax=Streptomyces tardus TaxID=2780544 RepID=A0A949N774_9ACTN|nr:NAD-dependent epimerase/dehydratase family protein [Streptomyces tardus]MBU7600754.1 NAD-dependent epimerase/dehydratase family protein [Streptomyces tardus]
MVDTPSPQNSSSAGLRVAVTGASGNVGTRVVNALGADPRIDTIVGLSRRAPDTAPPKTTWVTTDLGRAESESRLTAAFRGVDAVIHLAWLIQPSRDPHTTWAANVLGSERVLRAVAAARVPQLVYASSVAAYSAGPTSGQDPPVSESWPTHGRPTAPYSREKAYVERLLDGFDARHPEIRVARMRPSFIFQRAAAMEQRRLFAGPLLPNRLVRRGVVPVVPDIPGLRFQAVHADDVADAFVRAVHAGARGAFNLAGEGTVRARELALLLDARTIPVPVRPARAALGLAWLLRLVPTDPELFSALLRLPLMSSARAARELGWHPQFSGAEAVGELLEGLGEGAGGTTPPLLPRAPGGRWGEFATGVGKRP